MDMEKPTGEIIAEAREKAGLSQRKLSSIANINYSELSKIEAGKRKVPNAKLLRKISNYIDVNYNDLMYRIGLGSQISPLNPFLLDHYDNLKGQELDDAWTSIKVSIKNNNLLIETLQKRIDNDKLSDEDKETLIETIKDLEYQNSTNEEIIKLLESNMIKEKMKNEKNN